MISILCICLLVSIGVFVQFRGKSISNNQGYKSILLSEKDYKGSKLDDWIKTCSGYGGYYQFINSDPDSWDMYIYYPKINPELKYIKYNVNLQKVDTVIKVYLNEVNAISDEQVVKDLVLNIQAPLRGAWPSSSEVYINGNKVECIGQGFQD